MDVELRTKRCLVVGRARSTRHNAPPAQMWVDCTGLRSDETRFCTSLSPSAVTFHVSKIRMIARCAQCTIHVNAYCSSREYKLPDNVCFSILLHSCEFPSWKGPRTVLITEENVDPKRAQGLLRHATSDHGHLHTCSGHGKTGGSGPLRIADGAVMKNTGRKSQVNSAMVFVSRVLRYNGINQ
jgi:hypothetical protein